MRTSEAILANRARAREERIAQRRALVESIKQKRQIRGRWSPADAVEPSADAGPAIQEEPELTSPALPETHADDDAASILSQLLPDIRQATIERIQKGELDDFLCRLIIEVANAGADSNGD